MTYTYYRCSGATNVKVPSENFECFFMQTHQIAHAGSEMDFINNNIPKCKKFFHLVKRRMRLEVLINSILIGYQHRIFKEYSNNLYQVS